MSNPAALAPLNNLTLITGGARSGKSRFAETLAGERGGPVIYVATMAAVASDDESVERIKKHRQRRPEQWRTVELQLDIHKELAGKIQESSVCLIDCLSLYVSNMLLDYSAAGMSANDVEEAISTAASDLLAVIGRFPQVQFIVVTNEVGWGVVPENGLARAYRDLLGFTNQQFAQAAGAVWLCCAGLQLALKRGAD